MLHIYFFLKFHKNILIAYETFYFVITTICQQLSTLRNKTNISNLICSILMIMETYCSILQLSYIICTIIFSHFKINKFFIIWACWQTPLCFSSSLRSAVLHFWAEFSLGPAAEWKRLETIAEFCLFLHPEKEQDKLGCWNLWNAHNFVPSYVKCPVLPIWLNTVARVQIATITTHLLISTRFKFTFCIKKGKGHISAALIDGRHQCLNEYILTKYKWQ